MKRWYWLVVLTLPIAILSGCTSNSKYQLALDENAALAGQVADLNTQLDNLSDQLSDLQKRYSDFVYPPRDFKSTSELIEWLAKDKTNTLPTAQSFEEMYSRGLSQQLAALKAGFIISVDQDYRFVDYFFVMGVAVINGEIWIWDMDTDEPRQPTGFDKVSRGA